MGAGALVRRAIGLEVRAAGDNADPAPAVVSYSEAVTVNAILHATGAASDVRALAAVETAVGTWERAFAAATVMPAVPRLRALSPACLAMIGRALASQGEIAFAIDVRGGEVMLLPASAIDVAGPVDRWRYRLDVFGPSETATLELPAAAVLHFRIGVDHRMPWRGRDPIRYASATGRLAAAIERALADDARIPTGRVIPIPGNATQANDVADKLAGGGLVGIGTAGGRGSVPDPRAANYTPGRLGPAPPAELLDLRSGLARAILAIYGLSPSLYEAGGDGAGQREAWRRAWAGTFAPIARIMAAEIAEKLDVDGFALQLDELRAADEATRARAIGSRAQALVRMKEAGIELAEARRLAGLDA